MLLLAGGAGFVPGGLIARALLGDGPRTGFEGVAEVSIGSLAGVLVGLALGFMLLSRLERNGRLWGIAILFVVLLLEAVAVRMLN